MMADKKPLISVITACHNAESTIQSTLESVVNQKGVDGLIEHIVIDGASTDSTMEIVRRFPNIRWISEPDEGIADAFNKGMELAHGEYLLYLNADDWLYDDHVLDDAISFIQKHGRPDWIVGDIMMSRNGRLENVEKSHPPSCWSMIFRNRICHPAVIIKKSVQQDAGGFRSEFKFAMDFDLWQRLCSRGIPLTYWRRVISVFSIGGISSIGGERKDKEHRVILERFRDTKLKRALGAAYDLYQEVCK